MKTIISENQRGLKFKHGRFVKLLLPGKYITLGDTEIEVYDLGDHLPYSAEMLNKLLENPALRASVTVIDVADQQVALHFTDGRFTGVHTAGKHAFWNDAGVHTFVMADTSIPAVDASIPAYVLKKLSPALVTCVEIEEHQKGRLYYNGALVRLLDAGVHFFWRTDTHIKVEAVDTRLVKMSITGQELLTADKVTLRVNFVIDYRISDYVKIATEIDDYEEQLRVAAQLAMRDQIGRRKLDEVLSDKEEISRAVFARVAERAEGLYVTVHAADIKDLILPGEIRDIMNTVLVAEKRAQANVITRREEVASTRSLLNTARLMEENPTLYRLKELEYVERICENVGSINLHGSGDLLAQLSSLLKPKA